MNELMTSLDRQRSLCDQLLAAYRRLADQLHGTPAPRPGWVRAQVEQTCALAEQLRAESARLAGAAPASPATEDPAALKQAVAARLEELLLLDCDHQVLIRRHLGAAGRPSGRAAPGSRSAFSRTPPVHHG